MTRLLAITFLATILAEALQGDPLIRVGATWRFLPSEALSSEHSRSWFLPDFDASSWVEGRTGFHGGFGVTPEATWIRELGLSSQSAVFRHQFLVTDPESITWLLLRLDYQHGLVVYLNGYPVLSRGLGELQDEPIPLNQIAEPHPSGSAEVFDLTASKHRLQIGQNLIAVQVHGETEMSTGLTFNAELLRDFVRGPLLQRATPEQVTIAWHTQEASLGSVEFRSQDGDFIEVENRVATAQQSITLDGLTANTQYEYRIKSQRPEATATSKLYTFRTPSRSGEVRFAVLADSGQGTVAQYDIADQIHAWQPDLVLHGGDVVYPDFSLGRADFRCFSVYASDLAERQFAFAIGNHDINLGLQPFITAFDLFTNDTPDDVHALERTAPEAYYSFDHGDAHFVVLYVPFFSQYSLTEGNPQYQWLEHDLQRSSKPWKFIVLHHNVFSSSAHTFDDWDFNGQIDQEELQAVLVPLAREYGVQFVFTGHDHVFERFAPTQGVHFVTSAGGGGGLYNLARRLTGSAQFWQIHHFTSIETQGPELILKAHDRRGRVFDRAYYRRDVPLPLNHRAAWHTPQIEREPGTPLTDHNIPGQSFDLVGSGVTAITGLESNLGRLHVNHDQSNVYLGFEQAMLRPNQYVFLFCGPTAESPEVGLPIDVKDSSAPAALTLADNLSFSAFRPKVVAILGDEQADGTAQDYQRSGLPLALGEGVFSFDKPYQPVDGIKLQQYDHTPLSFAKPNEQVSNLIEIAIPKATLQLGEQADPSSVRVAAIVGEFQGTEGTGFISWDKGYLGSGLTRNTELWTIAPLHFDLQPNPDPDEDGLTNEEELVHGTNPDRPDSDGDQLPDGWEVRHALNPLSGEGEHSDLGDPDQDGATNRQEYQAGTDPQNAQSVLQLTATHLGRGIVRLSWLGQPQINYLLTAADQPTGPFLPLIEQTGPALNRVRELEYFDRGSDDAARFYQVIAETGNAVAKATVPLCFPLEAAAYCERSSGKRGPAAANDATHHCPDTCQQ